MKYSCIIVEDEPIAREKLEEYIKEIPFLELKKSFINPINVPQYLSENKIDLMFLDIEMGKFSGLDLLSTLDTHLKVIITTAYEQYAINGYEFNILDYLLKPYSFSRFVKATSKVVEKQNENGHHSSHEYVFIKTENRIEKVDLKEILYIEGMKDYMKIVTSNKKIMTLMNFKKMLNLLPKKQFIRVHNSFIVSLDKIEHIERDRILIEKNLIPISNTYKNDFFDVIKRGN
nr:LytTR family DNA-binding domain-containing protein [uncultured Allomuricauda sp.]